MQVTVGLVSMVLQEIRVGKKSSGEILVPTEGWFYVPEGECGCGA